MGGDEIEIPLFPLSVVLFPGMALPLHIFEPRYREMTQDCLDSDTPIGIVLALPESVHLDERPARVGTCARIADYTRLPDGKYNLLAIGIERFEILEVRHTRSYLTAQVRPLHDAPETGALDSLTDEARAQLEQYLRIVLALVGSEESREIHIPTDPEDLSYLLAMCLACEDDEKQRLLEMTSLRARLQRGLDVLALEIETLAEQAANGGFPSADGDRTHLN